MPSERCCCARRSADGALDRLDQRREPRPGGLVLRGDGHHLGERAGPARLHLEVLLVPGADRRELRQARRPRRSRPRGAARRDRGTAPRARRRTGRSCPRSWSRPRPSRSRPRGRRPRARWRRSRRRGTAARRPRARAGACGPGSRPAAPVPAPLLLPSPLLSDTVSIWFRSSRYPNTSDPATTSEVPDEQGLPPRFAGRRHRSRQRHRPGHRPRPGRGGRPRHRRRHQRGGGQGDRPTARRGAPRLRGRRVRRVGHARTWPP